MMRPRYDKYGGLKYFFQTYNPLLLITIHIDILIVDMTAIKLLSLPELNRCIVE